MDEISEKTWNEELNKQFLVKIHFRVQHEDQNLERKTLEYALFEPQRDLESQRLQLLKANQWANQGQRERIHLCSELEKKNRLHQESYARSCQEIEELKRSCYEKGNLLKTMKIGRVSCVA